ncbi:MULTISPECIES: hypothetical protein [unclassified Duganella]|uniref:hypothetical protein n=1 Tax=unclassified Duganella TaxID=2636909 RepID=UPI00088480C6|nr:MULTISPECIES: hypothetical protein [unclassified Duganella]SDH42690.1 hypothetical protein SAMN05216320_11353 [Duganella sp. OV458]SDK59760.1 hypothetical protein SAMN05428973_113109 [Duganella sp. OV510]
MALDFAVLSEDETSADIVSLEWVQHEVLIDLAEQNKLMQLLRFEDYFEEVDLVPSQLPKLAEELDLVKKSTAPPDIVEFANKLAALIVVAIKRKQKLSAVPD